MKNRIFNFVIGIIVTLAIASLTHYYLRHQKYKKGSEYQSAFFDMLEGTDLRFSDLKYKNLEHRKANADVVLVAVDNESITEVGRWPWGRDLMAQVNQKLMDSGVAAVGMDVIWSEPERGFPGNDMQLGKVIEKHADRIVLGTLSTDEIRVQPYQDYCVTEAFLATGGEELIKINPTFTIDDEGEELDNGVQWKLIFEPLFLEIQADAEKSYLREAGKKSLGELTAFQRNHLNSKKRAEIFSYCKEWLTPNDSFMNDNPEFVKALFQQAFSKNQIMQSLTADQQIQKIKTTVVDFPMPQYGEWQGNIPDLQKPALYTASFVAHQDVDGYVRRYPLFYRSGNRLGTSFVPSLALQTYLVAKGYRAEVTVTKFGDRKSITNFKIFDTATDPESLVESLPIDSQGRLIVNFYGPQNSLPYISAKDLLSDEEKIMVRRYGLDQNGNIGVNQEPVNKKTFLKGKSAILGVTAIAVYDLRNTAVEKNFPGPEIHLTVLANLLESNFLKKIPNEETVLPLVIIVAGVLLTWVLSCVGAFSAIACMAVVLAGTYYADKFLFEQIHFVASSLFFYTEIFVLHFTMLFYKYFIEEKKRSELRKTFSKYVSPAVVDELLKNEENLKLGGRKEEMSVFFSDVRGFTQFSEKMDPQDLSRFLNEYLTPMTEIIFKNKGTLDKYMGDGVMAFFGAPVPYVDHAYHACLCALQSIEALKKIQLEFDKRQWPKVEIGIGINTGFMSVGNMGSKIVQSYTVIGDAVNLGARLEGATKEYGVKILISETTYQAVKDKFIMREVDLVRVKGKKEPIRAYQLLDVVTGSTDRQWIELYDQAYRLYHSREFKKAEAAFSHIETLYPDDTLSKIYKVRCSEFIAFPPPSEWDGVFEMRTK